MAKPVTLTIPATGKQITVPTGLFINNEFVPSVDSTETIQCINPATEEVICSVVAGSERDIDVAVAAARKAFKTTWGKNVTGFERSRLINKLADLIERDAQELAELETLNNGKPVKIARDFDIGDSVQCLRYYAGWADKILGQAIEVDNKTKLAFTRHDPIGVCGQIIPWNYPINMWSWKVAPALACGCTIVMKPSEITPLTALKLSELIVEAGFPPGVVNTVPSLGSVGGAALSSHKDVDKVAFTGSTVTGRKIMEAAAKSNLKKVSLELGGKSPQIVFESADLDQAANWVALGILYNTGQDCTAGSRLFVQDTIYERFIEIVVQKFKQLKIGNGFDESSGGGPVVSKMQYDKIFSYIESGKQAGARCVLGGEKRPGKGYFVDPTVFVDVKPDMKIVRDEIFGPVLAVARFATEEEAVELANDTSYGLGAGLHSNDASQCMRVSQALEAGTVWVNQYNLLNNNVPFGGKKQSGIGRELGSYALEEYTSVKAIHWNYGEKLDWPL
ncbi:NAD-aldehyde dehydrogenase [Dichomitus squalens LYAD-421 SS1]|uniref:NAD-aldehyde dehydrogenase n=1 Tax=Dichomitus squalens TaxID=114155 RepID=A0A4Q9Q2R7_9APHY|nr:NAD-aldehyde dehydrogenase [Dichomitus squalens LYAD-421 SS1]EJF63030.1 NAD-aldehyde dehydrogenase [Dichomitus squalens LYAD-421 SS1]TBU32183.1 NAD-aldehyde dehydrogenase [Dichomitus squalens]TBU61340.1 NAD-aldehyde dehydrogenase [Dichomitus squalens]